MKTKIKRFLRKAEVFFKRNALAIIICTTTVLTVAIVGFSTYFSLKDTELNQQLQPPETEVNTPVSSNEPVVFVSPLENPTISKDYADNKLLEDKTTGIWQTHQAVDFSAKEGDKVFAVYAGTIESVKNDMMEGLVITLKISDSLKVVYKSLATTALVEEGDTVKTGQEIGVVGTSVTEKAEGVHLHLEVYENDKLINPNNYFNFTDK